MTILTENELMMKDDLRLLYDDDVEYDDDISTNFTTRVLRDFYMQWAKLIEVLSQRASENGKQRQRVRKKLTLSHPSSSNHHLSQSSPTHSLPPLSIEFLTSLIATRSITPEVSMKLIIESTTPQNKRVASNDFIESYSISSMNIIKGFF